MINPIPKNCKELLCEFQKDRRMKWYRERGIYLISMQSTMKILDYQEAMDKIVKERNDYVDSKYYRLFNK